MHKLLAIIGPTATGKTALALSLAKKFDGELISADSRQVYRGLDIGTGKDTPKDPEQKIWSIDIVGPKEEFSVAEYLNYAHKKIEEISSRGLLPILVGGTWLYIKAVLEGIATVDVPKNEKLRATLENKTASELFELLLNLSPAKAASLNNSDKNNPRRLIRAIEIASSSRPTHAHPFRYNTLTITLTAPKEYLNSKIKLRVEKRIEEGFEKEVNNLLSSGVTWQDQSMQSLGYRQWRLYMEGKISKNEAVDSWTREEQKYARRQLTWFKKERADHWFNVSETNWLISVEETVQKWYALSNEGKG